MARFLFLLCGLLASLALGAKDELDERSDGYPEWPHNRFQTGDWQPPHMLLRKVGNNIYPGKMFVSVRNQHETDGTAPTIYDNNGDMVWQGPHRKTMDFKMQKLFGQDVITFWDGETGVLGYGYGKVHILDNTYKPLYTITLEDDFVTPGGGKRESYVDVHEHVITPNNTIIVSAINITTTDLSHLEGGQKEHYVIDPLFYEIDIPTNKVLFKWDAIEHLDQIPLSKSHQTMWGGSTQHSPWDAYHMNSVAPTKDGYLVSIRFFWSAFYLNRDGTVRWQLGGKSGEGDFEHEDDFFTWQHDARIYDETDKGCVVSVFNNGGNRFSPNVHSTGSVVKVDLESMTATSLYELADPLENVVTRTQGSFQVLGKPGQDNMFMGYGSVGKVKEYDTDGNVVLAGQFGFLKNVQSYRGFKYDWHATPHYDPEIAVRHSSTYTTDVYMSWNGATDYDNWVIMSVPSMNATHHQGKVLANHTRTGFETHVAFENTNAKYIMAVARQGKKILRSSPVVEFEEDTSEDFPEDLLEPSPP